MLQTHTVDSQRFDLSLYQEQECVADLLVQQAVTMIENDSFGSGTGVFRYQADDQNGLRTDFVGLLLLDESIALASLTSDEAMQLANTIDDIRMTSGGRITLLLANNRSVPKINALGEETGALELSHRASLAVEHLKNEDGSIQGIGLWYEPGDAINQPGDEMFTGGFSAFHTHQALDVVAALRSAANAQ